MAVGRAFLRQLATAALVFLPFATIWPTLFYLRAPDLFHVWFWDNNIGRFLGFSVPVLPTHASPTTSVLRRHSPSYTNWTLTEWGTNFQTNQVWTFLGGFSMIVLMTLILVSGTRTTFRWQNIFWIIASVGTFLAFICLLLGSSTDFQQHFDAVNTAQGGATMKDMIAKAGVTFENTSETEPLVTLRYFGPEVNPDAPAMGAYRKNKFN